MSSNTNIGLAGEYAALSQLNLRGFTAALTLGHAKGVDIFAAYPGSGKTRRIEVKTRLKESYVQGKTRKGFGIVEREWFLSAANEIHAADLFYCFVHASESGDFEFHIVPSKDVAKHLIGRRKYLQSLGQNGPWPLRKFRLGPTGASNHTSWTPSLSA